MSSKLSDSTVSAWARLVRASQSVIGAIESDLRAAGLPPLDWYDVLLELERAGGTLRPREIAQEMLFARYSITRIVDRMEKERLVKRMPCPEDARGALVQITDRGRKLRSKMWPAYAGAIERHFGGKLTEKEKELLAGMLGKLTGQTQ